MVVCFHRFQLTVVCDRVAHYLLHYSICTLISLLLLLDHVIVAAIYVTGFLVASYMPTILLF